MNRLSVSIVIAAYNGEQFIGEQLRSLFAQTYQPSEILIGDDSENDLTCKAIENVISEAVCPVRIIRNEQRKGCSENFSSLAAAAEGDIIFFCDQDDVWLPEKIEKLVKELEAHPDIPVVFCNSCFVDKNLNDLGYTTADILNISDRAVYEINERKDIRNYIRHPLMYGHNIAFRKDFRNYFLPIPDRIKSYDLYINYVTSVKLFRYVPENLTLFRRHGTNTSPQMTFWQRLRSIMAGNQGYEIFDTWNHLDAAVEELEKKNIPEAVNKMQNFEFLKHCRDFFRKRLIRLSGNFLSRLKTVFFLKDYFVYGTGIKSFARDIIFGIKLTEEMKCKFYSGNQ